MILELKGFQEVAVQEVLRQIFFARGEVSQGGNPQAIVLSAPTGSGKTLMATAVMEALAEGTEEFEGDPEATFLWLSDLPELNEQSRRKIVGTSSVFSEANVVTLDASFDQETFEAGTVYFLNIQKLREGGLLVTPGDERSHTLWETVENTLRQRPTSFYVVIDEAHKGMTETTAERRVAQSIVQKFLKGSSEIEPVPLALGISATPERFLDLLQGSQRHPRKVEVPADEVRASGLLKETIFLFHPDDTQPADITLLKTSAERLVDFEKAWAAYHDKAETAPVSPLLVVQVEDASGSAVLSKTDLSEAVTALEHVLGPLDDEVIAHAFQEGTDIELDDRSVRYCNPSDIQDDKNLRVVLFKSSLNTGWDCPRAEVMMSFRKAADHTLIAQLVGRMVRTPMARRIETDEFLNTVSLYLPHYDKKGLEKVVEHLQNPDPGELPPIQVERGEDAVTLHKNPNLDPGCFEAVEKVPSYVVTSVRKMSYVKRVVKFGRRLSVDGILESANDEAKSLVVNELLRVRDELAGSEMFATVVKESGVIDLRSVELNYETLATTESSLQVPVTQENVDDLFASAGRKIGEGLHKDYWKARVKQDVKTKRRLAKLEIFALVMSQNVMADLEERARELLDTWQKTYWTSRIKHLSPDRQEPYHQIRQTAIEPVPTNLTLLDTIQGKKATDRWPLHLYVDASGEYPQDFTASSWEKIVLKEELQRSDIAAFLRNEPRKSWSFCVPYDHGPNKKPMYPDFLIVRSVDGENVVDVLEPHRPDLEDSWEKARGLALYAEKHGHLLGRIQFIIVVDGVVKRLDMTDEQTRNNVKAIAYDHQLRALFGSG